MPLRSPISVIDCKPAPLAISSNLAPRPEWIGGPHGGDRQQAADPHELLAVAGDNGDGPAWLRQRQAEADHGRTAHRAPEVEIRWVVAGVEDVVGR